MPRTILLALSLCMHGLPAAADPEPIRLSEPVAATETYEDFGAALDTEPDATSLASAMRAAPSGEASAVTVDAKIAKVCQKKGCFFIARDGAAMARVEFKDYGFFIPTDSAGKNVIIRGVLQQQTLSADRAAHLSDDLGGDAEQRAGKELVLIASAVRIPKNALR